MKKFVTILLFMSVLFTMFASVGQAAEAVPRLYLNGLLLQPDANPQIVNQSTVVPIRVITEGLGFQVEWDNATKTVTINDGSNVIKLTINNNAALVNDQVVQMETKPIIVKGTTLVPLRFVGEQFGLEFEWKADTKEVHIVQPPKQPTGWITGVSFDGIGGISVNYEGAAKPNKVQVLDNPKRIVLDFPNTSYSSNLATELASGQVKAEVTDNPLITSYRYSIFSNTPTVARVVLDVNADTGYVMTEGVGEYRIDLMPSGEVPPEPETPADPEPELPVEPEVPVDPQPPVTDNVYDVVLDAGHGGSDPGAQSVLKRWEKEFNLSIALKMQALMANEKSIKVHMTRTSDTYPTLLERIAFAENVKADMFISIHANSLKGSSATGSETYYYRENSKSLAEVIHKHLLAGTQLKDRGVKKEAFKVIKETTMPAVLLEAGFLSLAADSKVLFDDAAQNRIAAELVAGIKEYFKLK
ncbi:N-acetylmuramoyl-L-alanine amidase family protein [Paenibacillus harenae]|uniref:N-acetylmuramoyl-L-alanine amidase n=1 Tax=Paenibacillus harenae TaxID=306543 RepID=A0ABT9TVT0_PAEHA|nr:N-acetylmuramoyl-L-alanine amidase family protein [Paenibacillus harenae]MDQ0111472.1 N-acetylmuramoyl-L-alanine amidase [Paenibacillus harenae]